MAFQSLSRRAGRVLVAAVGAVTLCVSLAPAAHAEPTLAEVNSQLNSLSRKNEQLTELYNKATGDVAAKQKEAAAAKVAASKALTVYNASRVQLASAVNDAYRAAGRGGATAAILTSSSTANYVDQLATLKIIASTRNGTMLTLRAAKASADSATSRADSLLSDATARQQALAAQRTSLAADQDKYKKLLAKLTAAQRAAFFAKANPTASPTATKAAITTYKSTAATGAAAIAVAFALAQLGKPYVFAASGPDAFDCSGLTMAAWAAAGVSLPHFAESQYNYGTHVSKDALLPGDLVFFYQPIGHVALYIGNGLIVHAPTSGDVVKVVPLDTFASDYVGATRL